jgi:hypothetical protein
LLRLAGWLAGGEVWVLVTMVSWSPWEGLRLTAAGTGALPKLEAAETGQGIGKIQKKEMQMQQRFRLLERQLLAAPSIGWTGCAGELAPVRHKYNVLQAVGRPISRVPLALYGVLVWQAVQLTLLVQDLELCVYAYLVRWRLRLGLSPPSLPIGGASCRSHLPCRLQAALQKLEIERQTDRLTDPGRWKGLVLRLDQTAATRARKLQANLHIRRRREPVASHLQNSRATSFQSSRSYSQLDDRTASATSALPTGVGVSLVSPARPWRECSGVRLRAVAAL